MRQISLSRPQNQLNHEKMFDSAEVQEFFYLQGVTNVMELVFLLTGPPPRFRLVARSDKENQHARIIWSCAWNGDDKYFATASRDKRRKKMESIPFFSFFSLGFPHLPTSFRCPGPFPPPHRFPTSLFSTPVS